MEDTLPVCPGFRYYYVNVPGGGDYAQNVSFQVLTVQNARNFFAIFSNIYFRMNACPDVARGIYDYMLPVQPDTQYGEFIATAYDILDNGILYIALQCQNNTVPVSTTWTFQVQITPTCIRQCFVHGTCQSETVNSVQISNCICNSKYVGAVCNQLYPGFYTLMAVGGVLLCYAVPYLICCAIKFSKRKNPRGRYQPVNHIQE